MERSQLITWIEKSRQGDPDAQEKLVRETQNRVYYHCKKFLKNEQDAQDAAQDVLITMITSLDKLKEPAAFWGWLNGITANRCKHLLSRGAKEWQIPEDEEGNSMLDSVETLDDQTVPDKVLDNAETQRLVTDIIDALPPEQRMTVTFFYYDEMSVKEIAAAMDVSEGTVKSRLNYARKTIKLEVEKLEKKDGTKLYSVSILPFLAYFLRRGAQSEALSPAAAQSLTRGTMAAAQNASAGAGTAAAAAGTSAGSTAAGAATAVAAKAATGLGVKLIAGVLAGVLALGGVGAGVYVATHRDRESAAPVIQESVRLTLPQELEPLLARLMECRDAEDAKGVADLISGEEFQAALITLEQETVYTGDFSQDSGDVFRLYSRGYAYLGGWEQEQRNGRGLWFYTSETKEVKWWLMYMGDWANDLPNGQGVDANISYEEEYVVPRQERHGTFTNGLYDGVFTELLDGKTKSVAQLTYVNGVVQPIEGSPEHPAYDTLGNRLLAIREDGTGYYGNPTGVHTVPGFAYLVSENQSQPSAEPSAEPTPAPAYAAAYAQKVEELSEELGEEAQYGLLFIDGDDTPELVTRSTRYFYGDPAGDIYRIYTLTAEGEVRLAAEKETAIRDTIDYVPKCNVILSESLSGGTGEVYRSCYRMGEGEGLERFFSSTGQWDPGSGDITWNGAALPPEAEGEMIETIQVSQTAQQLLELLGA